MVIFYGPQTICWLCGIVMYALAIITITLGQLVESSTSSDEPSLLNRSSSDEKCASRDEAGHRLRYIWGDALNEPSDCTGPNDLPYPTMVINRMFRKSWATSSRTGRTMSTMDPMQTQKALLKNYQMINQLQDEANFIRTRRDFSHRDVCLNAATRLCKTRYNTTAPMYGVSLTSGQPVTIVQKFPDLLQQVIYEVCESNECDVVRGECIQTYVPYLFLVIPLGPVTLTGQDYVLVESGCICKPKSSSNSLPDPLSPLPAL